MKLTFVIEDGFFKLIGTPEFFSLAEENTNKDYGHLEGLLRGYVVETECKGEIGWYSAVYVGDEDVLDYINNEINMYNEKDAYIYSGWYSGFRRGWLPTGRIRFLGYVESYYDFDEREEFLRKINDISEWTNCIKTN